MPGCVVIVLDMTFFPMFTCSLSLVTGLDEYISSHRERDLKNVRKFEYAEKSPFGATPVLPFCYESKAEGKMRLLAFVIKYLIVKDIIGMDG